ncbi:amino acid transporter avt1i [Quercus suber]|uniref:Amino acid transporter avt1i n=1 Tax=Quercus suber TaxID=58331 RepID=A0AAW0MB78_QUESU
MVSPIVNAIKSWFPCQYNKRMDRLLISTSLVISTVIVALALPFFATLIYRKIGCKIVIIWCIILMGVALAISGTYISLVQIIGDL